MKRLVVCFGIAAVLVSGCSSGDSKPAVQTVPPATPAPAPSATTAPAGTVDPGTATAVLFEAGHVVTLVNRTVSIGTLVLSDVNGIFPGPAGVILAASGNRVSRIDVAAQKVTAETTADGTVTAATVLPDDRIAVGTDRGEVEVPGRDGVRVGGFASVDALAVVGNSLLALDRRQSMIIEVDVEDKSHGLALRTGQGAAQLATDHWGRILVTDPRTKELGVFTDDPLMMRQRIPTGAAPYAVAYDNKREIAWVTLTETNEVVGYDLATGEAREVHRYPTVRQPNALAVDPETGDLIIAGEGIQRIPG